MTEVIQQFNDLETSVKINEDYSQLTITMSQDFMRDIFSKKNFDYSGHLLGLITMVNTERIFITKDSDIHYLMYKLLMDKVIIKYQKLYFLMNLLK